MCWRKLTGHWVGSGIVVSIKGAALVECMVVGKDVRLRRLAKGIRGREVQFNRFLGNAKVTTERVIESWSEGTSAAAEGCHVLAIQDTSEINFCNHCKAPARARGDWQG